MISEKYKLDKMLKIWNMLLNIMNSFFEHIKIIKINLNIMLLAIKIDIVKTDLEKK